MASYRNNKSRILFCSKFLAFCSIPLALCFILCLMLYPQKVSSGPYLDSAHGNTSYGVNRTALNTPINFGYSIGNCAHCHEQHASIGGTKPSVPALCGTGAASYELFCMYSADPYSQTSFFCEACHMDPGISLIQQNPVPFAMPYQYNYSRIAGGDNNTCPNNIRTAFGFINDNCVGSRSNNCGSNYGSAHCLRDIVTFLTTVAPSSWNFAAGGIDPCSGCHNPHRAQRDHDSGGFQWARDNKSALSRPSTHSKDNNVWTLWGDDSAERMSNYNYQPPYRYGGAAYGYERW